MPQGLLEGNRRVTECKLGPTLAGSAVKRNKGTASLVQQTALRQVDGGWYRYLPMETPQTKSEIIRAIEDLPDDATVEDAMERLYFLAKIERGLEQAESGETVSHAEIKARFLR
jgi:predicted transcriptional regulator